MKSRTRKAASAAFLLWLCGTTGFAQSTEPLTLEAALRQALTANPVLQTYPFRTDALRGEAITAGLAPPLQVNTTLEDAFGTDSLQGIDSAELTLSLSRVVELGGKRMARTGVMSRRLELLQTQQRISELDLLADVTRHFIAVAAAQQQLLLQQRAVTLARQTLDNVQTLVDAGQVPAAEQQRAAATLAQASLEQQHADAGLQVAKLELAGLWASQQPGFDSVSADLFAVGDAGDLNALMLGLGDLPDVQLFASEERLQHAQLVEAQSERRGNVQWSVGIRHLSGAGDTGFVMGASMPLGSANRAGGAIAAAQAAVDEVATRRADALNRLRTQLSVLHVRLRQAIAETHGLRDQVLPPLNNALEQTRAAYLGGRYGYLELASAQNEVLVAELALIDAATDAHLLRAEIERLGGTALNAVNAE
jgi:cobalt-zinc-cadmium efflux system outer membrane protein